MAELNIRERQAGDVVILDMDGRITIGEGSVTLGTGMKGGFRERTHENPAALPGKSKPPSQ